MAVVVAVLAVSNAVSNRLLPAALYVPWNVGVAAAVLVVAVRLDHRRLTELGLGRDRLGAGLRVGGLVVALTIAVYLVAVAVPATRTLFEDRRVEGLSGAGVLYRSLVRVPLGTVVLEEVAFRGVLPAMLVARLGRNGGVALAAGLFGLWHVLPSIGLGDMNPVVDDVFGGAGTVVVSTAAVVATAAAGVALWWLRDRSGSLAAPMLAHWSTNGLGYLLAYLVTV